MPVITGEKTAAERFPGAIRTLSIEAMMQDHKALQSGTSHFLGQNFAKAQDITYQSEEGKLEHCWTTSWGRLDTIDRRDGYDAWRRRWDPIATTSCPFAYCHPADDQPRR